jgi:hypothetical protein
VGLNTNEYTNSQLNQIFADEFAEQHIDDAIQAPIQNNIEVEQQGGAIDDPYTFQYLNQMVSNSERFRLRESVYHIIMPNLVGHTFMQSIRQMNRMFDDLHQTFVEPIRDDQLVRLIFNHDMFNWAVNTNLVKKEKLTAGYLKYLFEEQVQSYKETPEH